MKNLENMSLEELWQLFPVILKEYNPNYLTWYEDEKNNLVNILAEFDICRINHIGSTAVKDLLSKPTIDILLELPNDYDMDKTSNILTSNGWLIMATSNNERTIDLNKGYTINGFAEKVFHLHVKPLSDWGELYFRDYLRSHHDVSKQYEKLKLSLKEKYEHNREAYTDAKSDFILEQTKKAREEFGERYMPQL